MVVPFRNALERRSRTTYRPTVTPWGSTHVVVFTGTTSSVSRTAAGKLAEVTPLRQPLFAASPAAHFGRPSLIFTVHPL